MTDALQADVMPSSGGVSSPRPWLVDAAAAVLVVFGFLLICSGLFIAMAGALTAYVFGMMSGTSTVSDLWLSGIGIVVVVVGGLEWLLANKILAGAAWARVGAMVVSALLALLSAGAALAAVDPAGAVETIAIPVANAFVVLALIPTRRWFSSPQVRGPIGPVSPRRRQAFWLVVVVGAVAILFRFGAVLGPQGNGGSLGYLRSFSENDLAYPGATLLSERDRAASDGFFGLEVAVLEHRYESPATADTVIAWYDRELVALGWVRDDFSETDRENRRHLTPRWHKGFALLSLLFDPANGSAATTYAARIDETNLGLDPAPLAALRALPAVDLAYPGSTVSKDPSEGGRITASSIVHAASIGRHYETLATVDDVFAFYDRELREQGWTVGFSKNPGHRSWQLGDTLLGLKVIQRDADVPTTEYDVSIEEVLGPNATPGLPWE